jgi:hypothetical protein
MQLANPSVSLVASDCSAIAGAARCAPAGAIAAVSGEKPCDSCSVPPTISHGRKVLAIPASEAGGSVETILSPAAIFASIVIAKPAASHWLCERATA